MRKVELNVKKLREINRQNAKGKKWIHENGEEINPDFVVKCYDLYKQGKMTSRQLFATFPGRTMKAIESKVWKIRGRAEPEEYNDPDQMTFFTELLDK